MPVVLSDEILKQMGMTADEARIEIACRLFQARKLELWPAARLAGLSRVAMEAELMERRIPIYYPTVEDLHADLRALDRILGENKTSGA